MAEYIQASTDRQRREAIGRLLLRAIDYFPAQLLKDADRARARALAAQATSSVQPPASDQPPENETGEHQRRRMLARLAPRLSALTALLQLQKLLVPCLVTWRRQTQQRHQKYLEEEDSLSDAQLEQQLSRLKAYAEAVRILDACTMVLDCRLFIPYRRAVVNLYGVDQDEEVPELRSLLAMQESIRWSSPELGHMPFLGNPLQGPAPYVEELVFDCGVPVSEDFQLLGLAWADAVVQYGLGAARAQDYLYQGASVEEKQQGMRTLVSFVLPGTEQQVCKLLLTGYKAVLPLSDPRVQRGVWMVLGSLQELVGMYGGDVQTSCPLLARNLSSLLARVGMQRLDPRHAPSWALAVLEGTPYLPARPPPPALLRAPAAVPAAATAAVPATIDLTPAAEPAPSPTPVLVAHAPVPAVPPTAHAAAPNAPAAAAPELPPGHPTAASATAATEAAVTAPGCATAAAAAAVSHALQGLGRGLQAPAAPVEPESAPAGRSSSGGIAAALASAAGAAASALTTVAAAAAAAVTAGAAATVAATASAAAAAVTRSPRARTPEASTGGGATLASVPDHVVMGSSGSGGAAAAGAGGRDSGRSATAEGPGTSAAGAGGMAGGSGADADAEEESGGEEEEVEAAMGSGQAATGGGAAAGGGKKRKKKKKKGKGKGQQAAEGAAAAATVGAAGGSGAAVEQRVEQQQQQQQQQGQEAAAAAPDPLSQLVSAVVREVGDCCICAEEFSVDKAASIALLSCVVRRADGPFHALCNTCWAGLPTPRCPLCCADDVEGLDVREFMERLQRGEGEGAGAGGGGGQKQGARQAQQRGGAQRRR